MNNKEPNEYLGEQLKRVEWEPDIAPTLLEINILTGIWRTKRYRVATHILREYIKLRINAAFADYRAATPPSDGEAAFNQDQTAWNLAAWIHDNIIMHAEAFDSESDKLDVMAGEFHAALSAARGNRAELEAAAGEVVLQRKNHAIILNKDIDGDFIAALNALAVLTSEVGE